MTVPAILAFVLWNILHVVLSWKYDDLLFKGPNFRRNELLLYTSWPISLLKSMVYMLLLSAPEILKKKRFKGLELDFGEEKILVLFYRLFFVLAGVGLFFIFILLLWGTLTFFEDPLAIKF